jgi:DNA invertase Pin-like site-specific DNA recombinase
MARKSRKALGASNQAMGSEAVYKAGLYARLSVEDLRKKESDSIGTQMTLLRQFISEQPDMLPVGEYEDIDRTGTNFKRPGFTRLLDDIRAKKINCVIVKDLSRFGRNHIETGNYLERVFPFMGVRFISVCDNYDSLSESSGESLIIPLKNLINEVYAKDISKKTRLHYEMKRKKGDFCGCFAPYGYIKKGHALVIDEQAAEVVQRIFNLVIKGHSDLAIAKILNDDGIYPPNRHRYEQGILKGKKHGSSQYWYKSVVKRITENTAYLGRLEQGKYRKDLMNSGGRINISADKWVAVDGTHIPIVSQETFDAVKKIREQRKQKYSAGIIKANLPKSSENILKGLIYCADCLRNMIRHKTVKKDGSIVYRFLCPTYEEMKNNCTKKSLSESELLPLLHSFIESQMQTLADINKIMEDVCKQANYAHKTDTIDVGIVKTRAKLSRIMGLRSSLYEDFKEGILDESDYILAKSKYESQYKALADELDNLLSLKSKHEGLTGQNKWAAALAAFAKHKELNRGLITSLIERIDVDSQNDVTITVKYRDEYEALMQTLYECASEVSA